MKTPQIKIIDVDFHRQFMGDLIVEDYTAIIEGVVEVTRQEIYEMFFDKTNYNNLFTQADLAAKAYAIDMERAEEDLREDMRSYRHGGNYGRAGYSHLESSRHSPELG